MLHFRITKNPHDVLSYNADKANLSISEYCRQVLSGEHPPIINEITFDSTDVLEIFRGLGNCRGNLNQIATHLNQGGELNQQVRNQVIDCISELYEMRDKLEEMVDEYRGSH